MTFKKYSLTFSIVALIGFVIICGYIFIDKLLLTKNEVIDLKKVKSKIELADSLRTISTDSSLLYFNEALLSLKDIDEGEEEMHLLSSAYLGIAHTYSEMGDYDLALENDSIAMKIAIDTDDKPIKAKAFLVKGLTLFRLGDYSNSLDCYSKSMELAIEIKDSVIQAKIFSNRAMIYFYQGEIQKAIELFSTALEIGTRIKNETLIASNYMNLGIVYSNQTENDKALKNFEIALEKYKKLNDKKGELTCYQQLGNICYDLSEYAKAIDYYQMTTEMAKQMNDKSMLAKGYHNLAEVYSHLGDVAAATDFYFKSIKIKEQINNKLSLARGYIGLGALYYKRDDYANALTYFKKSLTLSTEVGSPQVTGSNFNNIANIFSAKHQSDSAIFYYNKALSTYQNIDYQWGISNILINLGSEYCEKNDYSLSEKFFKEALNSKKELEDEEGRATVLHFLAKLYMDEAGYASENEKINLFRKAEESGLESYNTSKRIGTIPVMKDASGILKEIYKKQEKYSEALYYSEIFNSLNDSLLNTAKIEALSFAEARWNAEKNQQKIDNLENTQKLNNEIIQRKEYETRQLRIIIWIIVALFLISLGFGIIVTLYIRKKRDMLYQRQLANISMLKMQNIRNAISPHFMFNVLNNVWAIIDDRENARSQFDNLVNLIRRSLINTEKVAIPLNEEIDFVRSYIELQKLMLDDDLEVKWNIESVIDINQLVPGMILHIPVENAIKHGLSPKKNNRLLQIDIKSESGFLQFVISDNGIGLQNGSSLTQGTGTGLKVLTNTIHILNQNNERKMSYKIQRRDEDGVSGTKVIINIPLHFNYSLN